MAYRVEKDGDHWLAYLSQGSRDGRRRKKIRICPPNCMAPCADHSPRGRARTKTDAKHVAAELEREWLRRAKPAHVADIAARWLDTKVEEIEPTTWTGYEGELRLRILPAFGHCDIRDLTVADIKAWVRGLDVAPRTAEMSLGVLRQVCSQAIEERLLDVNPAREVKRPKQHAVEVEIPSPIDVTLIINGLREHAPPWLTAFIMLTHDLGWRLGEGAGLRWSRVLDLDGDDPAVTIDTSVNKHRTIKSTKARTTRTIPIEPATVEIFQALRHLHVQTARDAQGLDLRAPDPDHFVFYSPLRGLDVPRRPESIARRYKLYVEAHNLPAITTKQFRHLFGSRVYAATGDEIETAYLLGHTSPAMIREVYGHSLGRPASRKAIRATGIGSRPAGELDWLR